MKTYAEGYKEGMEAVGCRPKQAPTCPYDEDDEPSAHNGWMDGAIEAGISEIYTNGVLDE